jgi:hypothetical protein
LYVCHCRRQRWLPHLVAAGAAYVVAPAASIAFLLREHALDAFLTGFRSIVPYYASLGHRSLGYILVHSVSPVLLMVYLWIVLQAIDLLSHQPHNWLADWERTTLLASAAFALLDCILQARALPYYRYPLLAFLLPVMAIDFHRTLERYASGVRPTVPSRKIASLLAFAGLAFGGFVVAPQSALLIHRYRWWQTDFITSLQNDLATLGGPALSRHIQFIDSVSGCPAAFYDLRLEPASGALADYLLFGPDSIPIVRNTRQQFANDIFSHPPQIIVVSSHLHFGNLENFHKLDRWPALEDFLAARYTLRTEWRPTRPYLWWSRPEMPDSYRIYVLRNSQTPHS